jgi:hypothetical protein
LMNWCKPRWFCMLLSSKLTKICLPNCVSYLFRAEWNSFRSFYRRGKNSCIIPSMLFPNVFLTNIFLRINIH